MQISHLGVSPLHLQKSVPDSELSTFCQFVRWSERTIETGTVVNLVGPKLSASVTVYNYRSLAHLSDVVEGSLFRLEAVI